MNMRMLILSIVIVAMFSCEEPVTLDLRQTPPTVVIEALVTNQPGYQAVKVTRSVPFYDKGKTPRITDAVVTVTDDAGMSIDFIHNPRDHADSAGIYVPLVPFAGTVGRTYTLRVAVGDEVYEGSDKLHSVIPMDSLKYRLNEDRLELDDNDGEVYELLMYAREPQQEENYYLFRFYRNDTLNLFNDTDIYFTDDEFLAEKIDGVPSPVYYRLNDCAKVEVFSLSRLGYVYYNDLWTLLNNDGGGMFGPVPAPPRSNLSNGALGFFQVSAVNVSEVKVE